MRFTIPDYYRDFQCIASDCPATCCAGWQIVIDEQALKKYRACKTPFGNRLANSIDWEEQTFLQYHGRCAFLDERNLCDIYSEAGPDMLCRTCRRYPRHIEEFENERELSLSVSCPVVARMLLARQEPVRFLSWENDREEQEDDFDFFLYSALQDCRAMMLQALQDRRRSVQFRMAKVLAMAHDVQNRIDHDRIFEIEEVLERYTRKGADEKLEQRFAAIVSGAGRTAAGSKVKDAVSAEAAADLERLFDLLDELEVLDSSWPEQVKLYRRALFTAGSERGGQKRRKVREMWEKNTEHGAWLETEQEQLMVYFLFTYFCGAVYDGDALSKVKMAVVSTLLLREMELAAQILWEEPVTLEDRARIVWRYSRELEHSDDNLNRMEELMEEQEAVKFQKLLGILLLS